MKVRSSIFLMMVVMVVPASGFIEMLQDFFAALNPMADADTPDATTPSPTAMSSYYKPRNPTFPSPAPTSPYSGNNFNFPTPITYGTQPQPNYYPGPTAGYPSYYQNTLQNPASSQQSSGKSPFIYSPALAQPGSSAYQNTADASKTPTDYNSFLTNPGSQAAQAYPQSGQNAYPPNNYYPQPGYPQAYPQYDPNYPQSGSSYPMSQSYPQPGQSYPQSAPASSQQMGQSPGSSSGQGGMSQQEMNNYLMGLYFGLQNPGLMSLIDYMYGLPPASSGMGSGMGSGLGGGLMNSGFGGLGWPLGGMSGPLSGPMGLTLGPLSAPLARSNANSEMSPMDMAMTMHIMEAQDLI